MVVNETMYVLHGAFAALWVGSVLFVVLAVLPAAYDGNLEPEAVGSIVSRFRWLTRISALALLITGGHLAGLLYDANTLLGTDNGQLVLAMVALWAALAATVEIGSSRAVDSVGAGKKREPARKAKPFYYAAAVFAVGLLIVAGLLGAGRIVGV